MTGDVFLVMVLGFGVLLLAGLLGMMWDRRRGGRTFLMLLGDRRSRARAESRASYFNNVNDSTTG